MTSKLLITGGTGKTGSRVVAQLRKRGFDALIGTRSPKSSSEVHFEWANHACAEEAFAGIRAVYLVAPTDRTDHLAVMRPMLEQALAAGVRRYVLLSSSQLDKGGPMMGEVHDWLSRTVPEWCVLRPSWFMQNFSEGPHQETILSEGAIYSSTGVGRVGFIDANDIATSAVAALTNSTAPNHDVILTGPEALSYEDVAGTLSSVTRRGVEHVGLRVFELEARFKEQGLDPHYAQLLAELDEKIRGGAESRITDGVIRMTGTEPTSFRQFAEEAVARWIPTVSTFPETR